MREKSLVKTRANFYFKFQQAQDVGRIDNDVAVANTKDKPTWLLILPAYRRWGSHENLKNSKSGLSQLLELLRASRPHFWSLLFSGIFFEWNRIGIRIDSPFESVLSIRWWISGVHCSKLLLVIFHVTKDSKIRSVGSLLGSVAQVDRSSLCNTALDASVPCWIGSFALIRPQ